MRITVLFVCSVSLLLMGCVGSSGGNQYAPTPEQIIVKNEPINNISGTEDISIDSGSVCEKYTKIDVSYDRQFNAIISSFEEKKPVYKSQWGDSLSHSDVEGFTYKRIKTDYFTADFPIGQLGAYKIDPFVNGMMIDLNGTSKQLGDTRTVGGRANGDSRDLITIYLREVAPYTGDDYTADDYISSLMSSVDVDPRKIQSWGINKNAQSWKVFSSANIWISEQSTQFDPVIYLVIPLGNMNQVQIQQVLTIRINQPTSIQQQMLIEKFMASFSVRNI